MAEIVSREYARTAGLSRYFTGEPCCNGHVAPRATYNAACDECRAERRAKPEARKAAAEKSALWRKNNPGVHNELMKQWRMDNPERYAASQKAAKARKPEMYRAIQRKAKKKWEAANPELTCAMNRARSRRLNKATPQWVDRKALTAFYQRCPDGMEVDHVVPVCGKNVCGLHVIWNLQYLTVEQNRCKSNHWPWPGATGLAFSPEIN